jgi:hypothetical protein
LSEERRKGEEYLSAVDVKGVASVLEKGRVVRRERGDVFYGYLVRYERFEGVESWELCRTVSCHGCLAVWVFRVAVEIGHARRAGEAAVNNWRIMGIVV